MRALYLPFTFENHNALVTLYMCKDIDGQIMLQLLRHVVSLINHLNMLYRPISKGSGSNMASVAFAMPPFCVYAMPYHN